tara:strand:+ start:274 stop:477 length:204 start_codon:yes stop_codon:yes gene_type:complete
MDYKKRTLYLEIAIDLLDRAEGTKLYDVTRRLSGWSRKDYEEMLEMLALLLIKFKKLENKEDEDKEW